MAESWVITIDGPAGSGKSTAARMLAGRLDAVFLDTGATYRAVTAAAMEQGLDLQDTAAIEKMMNKTEFRFEHEGQTLKIFIDGRDFTERIREPEVTENVRHIASTPVLRERLVELQREFAALFSKVVAEGRDQGTVVFPNAQWKFFLKADACERARRRQQDFERMGKAEDLENIREQIERRDASDINRQAGPLLKADDAIEIDSTSLTPEQVAEEMLAQIRKSHG